MNNIIQIFLLVVLGVIVYLQNTGSNYKCDCDGCKRNESGWESPEYKKMYPDHITFTDYLSGGNEEQK